MIGKKKLWLVGDDEVLDAIADLSRHLDYFQVARVDELPAGTLDGDDHVIIAMNDLRRGADLVARAHTSGSAGLVELVPELPGKTVGARAIVAAAKLVEKL
jgi:hypothetical protein